VLISVVDSTQFKIAYIKGFLYNNSLMHYKVLENEVTYGEVEYDTL
jgi:hypothetical protein